MLRRLLVWLSCCMGALAGPAAGWAQMPGQTELAPVSAALLLSDATTPPPNDALWEPITLPDNWGQRGFRPAATPAGTVAWYRAEFEVSLAQTQSGSWSLYVPYLYRGGRFFLNWRPLGDITEPTPELAVKWERPHLLPVADGALKPGRNVVFVRVAADPSNASVAMPRLVLGPSDDMLAVYEHRLFDVRTMSQFTAGLCVVVGLLVLFIWARRREEVLYGIFGLCALLWGVHTLDFVIEALPPAQWALWRLLYAVATAGFAATLAWFTWRSLGGPGAWRRPGSVELALLLGIAVAALAAAHDALLQGNAAWLARLAPDWVGERHFVLPHAANAVLVLMGATLANRFINTLMELEALNRTLDRRVAEREAVIEQNYQRLLDLEGQRLAGEERQRILQDMHDGLGAQLFSSLSRVERKDMTQQQMSDALRSCIAEMRLAIDSLSTSEDDFEATFGDFRHRWEPQLAALGMVCAWQVDMGADAPRLAPHQTLQILRIVQEALANVLKHSQARHLQVRLAWAGAELRAEVEDDGVGLPDALRADGRGLRNMRTRAGRLHGSLVVDSRPGRTVVRLTVPAAALAK